MEYTCVCVKVMYVDVYPSKPSNVVDCAEADDYGPLLTEMFIYCH